MRFALLIGAVCALLSCRFRDRSLTELLSAQTGVIELPAGTIEVPNELRIPPEARDLEIRGAPAGTILRAADGFQGRAVLRIEGGWRVTVRNLRIDGNRAALERRMGLPPSDVPFADFTPGNGILARDVAGLSIRDLEFAGIAGMAVLVSRCSDAVVERIRVTDAGSRNSLGRNNATGGVLFEEGTAGFAVRDSEFRNVRGNAVWTHSLYTSPRNRDGVIHGNRFFTVGRDAIQVGHATNVRVEQNRGERIGYPAQEIDVEGGGVPVALDTAGNVDRSVYAGNRFEEINGKCIDLDGFHHGQVSGNTCVNTGAADDYPFGHYGIVMNNSNPDMESERIAVEGNVIEGTKFGGIFVIGRGHRIAGNRLRRLNTAGCNESAARFGCSHFPGEPDLLQSGIYLGRRAERPAPASGNVVEGNEISGHRMAARCVGYAPGVSSRSNTVRNNRCSDSAE